MLLSYSIWYFMCVCPGLVVRGGTTGGNELSESSQFYNSDTAQPIAPDSCSRRFQNLGLLLKCINQQIDITRELPKTLADSSLFRSAYCSRVPKVSAACVRAGCLEFAVFLAVVEIDASGCEAKATHGRESAGAKQGYPNDGVYLQV